MTDKEIICKWSRDHSNRDENLFVQQLRRNGVTGAKLSAETRAHISASNLGKTRSTETYARMSAAQRGKKHSTETRKKIGDAKRGKKHSAKTKAKMSASQLSRQARNRAENAQTRGARCPQAPYVQSP